MREPVIGGQSAANYFFENYKDKIKPPSGGFAGSPVIQACLRMNSVIRGAIISRQRRPEKMP